MTIAAWSKTAAQNNDTPPAGFPDTMNPSQVPESNRTVMADIRTWYETAEWIDYGGTVSYVSATSFTIDADVTAFYVPGRRLKLFGSTLGTLYGEVVTSSLGGSTTTITVTIDDGTALTGNLSQVWYGILSPTNISFPELIAQNKNILVSGDFRTAPWQEGTTIDASTTPANNDGTYIIDNWILISDGNDIVDISQGSDGACRFNVQTANKQFGIVQLIENLKMPIINQFGYVSLSIKAKGSATQNIRAAVLSWTGTADSPTKDVVQTWAGGGTDPTWAASYTAENTPSNLALTSSYKTFRIPNIAIDTGSVNNLAIVIWLDDVTTSGSDTLDILQVQLQVSQSCSDFEYLSHQESELRAQAYFAKTYNYKVALASLVSQGRIEAANITSSTVRLFVNWQLPVRMISNPTVTFYNPTTGAAGGWRDSGGSNRSMTTAMIGQKNIVAQSTNADVPASTQIYGHIKADARIGA